MFEAIRIKWFGTQPVARITDAMLERLIKRDYSNHINEVKQKLSLVDSDTNKGRNRISAAILKLANGDLNKIDHYIEISNNDYRDVIAKAEYPRAFEFGFKSASKSTYLADWHEYSNWLK
jgi:uncharacterized protein YgbK (DUF1537 family)